jgi:hypothetical protein
VKEPGTKPSADNITLFLVAYPTPIIDNNNFQSDEVSRIESTPVACGALRHLEEGYMEVKIVTGCRLIMEISHTSAYR